MVIFLGKNVALFSTLKMKNCQKKIGTYTTHTRNMQIRDRGGICAPPPALNRVNRSGDLWNFSTFDIRVALYVKYNWEEKWEIKNRMTQLCFHIQFIFHSKFSKHFFGFISSKYRVSLKKGTLAIFVFFCSSKIFHMCFVIRISCPFHLATQIISIQNPNCPNNAKSASVDLSFGMFFYECGIL